MSEIYLPAILLDIPRNTVAAIGLPLCLGILSGSLTAKVVRGDWYKASTFIRLWASQSHQTKEFAWPARQGASSSLPYRMAIAVLVSVQAFHSRSNLANPRIAMGYASHLAVNALDAASSPLTR